MQYSNFHKLDKPIIEIKNKIKKKFYQVEHTCSSNFPLKWRPNTFQASTHNALLSTMYRINYNSTQYHTIPYNAIYQSDHVTFKLWQNKWNYYANKNKIKKELCQVKQPMALASRFLNCSILSSLPIMVVLHVYLVPSSWPISKNALMVENLPMLDSCDTPLLLAVSAFLSGDMEFCETSLTLCKLWRTATYKLSSRSAKGASKVLHGFRHLSFPSVRSSSSLFSILIFFFNNDEES